MYCASERVWEGVCGEVSTVAGGCVCTVRVTVCGKVYAVRLVQLQEAVYVLCE